MLCRPFREYSQAEVWKIRIPGRPNQGMPQNRGWAANTWAVTGPICAPLPRYFTVNTSLGLPFQRAEVQLNPRNAA
jgi:hypothetical protein